jgi:glycosyltransferase involved in cell wall biosynthesis
MTLPRTIFVGKSKSAVCWYRCALPAMALGQDWIGIEGVPPGLQLATGRTERPFDFEHLVDYDVVVLQQPEGPWASMIRRLQTRGITVLFEIDDYVQAVRKMASHEGRAYWSKERVAGLEQNMRLADGLICSTDYLARRYRSFNKRVWTCRNGLDMGRYAYERAPREGVTIGWAGGVGHTQALAGWLPEVAAVLRDTPGTRFVSVGQPAARELQGEFGAERAVAIPFGHMESYPASMTAFDVALAPAGRNNLYKGKSDLRWLEASALGIPLIADPDVYPEIEHGVTGFHAATPAEAREALGTLVADPALRERVGAAAHAHVREHRSIGVAAQRWAEVLVEARGGAEQRDAA